MLLKVIWVICSPVKIAPKNFLDIQITLLMPHHQMLTAVSPSQSYKTVLMRQGECSCKQPWRGSSPIALQHHNQDNFDSLSLDELPDKNNPRLPWPYWLNNVPEYETPVQWLWHRNYRMNTTDWVTRSFPKVRFNILGSDSGCFSISV